MRQPLSEHRLSHAGHATRRWSSRGDGCGHCAQLREPDRFAALLLEFSGAPGENVA